VIAQIPWSKEAEAGLIKSAGADLGLIKNQVSTKTRNYGKLIPKPQKVI